MVRKISVRGIIIHDGKLLCVRLKPYGGITERDYWCVPGGTLEPGEPIYSGLEREIIEETGIKPEIGNLLYIQQFTIIGREQFELFFHIKNSKDFLNINLSKTTHGLEEIETIDFIDPSNETVEPKFLSLQDFTNIQNNQPTQIFSYLNVIN